MLRAAAVALLLTVAAPAAAQGAPPRQPVGESGTLEGAPYRIDVPANWNRGGLVVLFHGYEGEDPREQRPAAWPAARDTAVFLARGYAVIQSGYSRRGWAVAEARVDTRRLRAAFEQRFGRPRRAFVAGYSMGGHLTLATIEQEADRYDGALAMCPVAISATDLFDAAVMQLAAADALFPGIIPDLAAPNSFPVIDAGGLGRAMAANPEAARQLATLMGVRAADVPGTLFLFYAATREIIGRAGGFPGGNEDFRYRGFGDDAAFNARVRRYTASPAARPYLEANATLTGRIADPVVLLANAYDDIVAARTTDIYPARVRAAGQSRRLIIAQPVGEGHCRFTDEQVGAAFDRLVREAQRRRGR